MRKKMILALCCLMTLTMLTGCSKVAGKVEEMKTDKQSKEEEKKLENKTQDIDEILQLLLEKIDEFDDDLTLSEGVLKHTNLGMSLYEIVDVTENPYVDPQYVEAGYWVRPIMPEDNPRMLMITKVPDREANGKMIASYQKQLSEQYQQYPHPNLIEGYLLKTNKCEQHSVFTLYVTWEKADELVKVVEKNVK